MYPRDHASLETLLKSTNFTSTLGHRIRERDSNQNGSSQTKQLDTDQLHGFNLEVTITRLQTFAKALEQFHIRVQSFVAIALLFEPPISFNGAQHLVY